jgi:hypothetical protein
VPGIRDGALAMAAVLSHLGLLLTGAGALTIVSTAVLATVLIGLVAAVAADGARIARMASAPPLTRRVAGLREKSWSAAFQSTIGGPGGRLTFAGPAPCSPASPVRAERPRVARGAYPCPEVSYSPWVFMVK